MSLIATSHSGLRTVDFESADPQSVFRNPQLGRA
jgi:hypothetical protein